MIADRHRSEEGRLEGFRVFLRVQDAMAWADEKRAITGVVRSATVHPRRVSVGGLRVQVWVVVLRGAR